MSDVTVVLAADDGYAMPLTVAARSVAATLEPGLTLSIAVLDIGIEPSNRSRIEASLDLPDTEVIWIGSLEQRIANLPNTWPIITRAGYARIFIPEVLPDLDRALYLDCDVLARRSVADLTRSAMDGNAAMGVLDVQAPFVPDGVPNWYEAGRSAADLNFNSGVLLMDLAAWRAKNTTNALLDYFLGDRYLRAQDQEGINAVLGCNIGHTDPRWNQQAEIFWEGIQFHYEAFLPFDRPTLEAVRRDPWIIHFSSHPKPWHFSCRHPFLTDWFTILDDTAYAGWRPPEPSRAQRLARSCGRRGVALGRRLAAKL